MSTPMCKTISDLLNIDLQNEYDICLQLNSIQMYGHYLLEYACFPQHITLKRQYSSKQHQGALNKINILHFIMKDSKSCLHMIFYKVFKCQINITMTTTVCLNWQ